MRILGALRSDLKRLLLSSRFWMALAAVILLVLANVLPEARNSGYETSIYYLVSARRGMGAFLVAMVVTAALPYGLSYREDVRNNYMHGLEIRSGGSAMGWSHVLTAALGAFLVIFVGYAVSFGMLSFRIPLFDQWDLESLSALELSGSYDSFIAAGHPIMYFIAVFATEAAGYAFLAVFTLMISAKIKNAFLVLSAPLMLYYGSLYICLVANLPSIFRWYYILSHGGYFSTAFSRPWHTLIGVIVYFSSLICIEGLIFTSWIRRGK